MTQQQEEDENEIGICLDELTLVDSLPANVELECPVCLQVMWKEPYLVTCCGHHFCSYCIQQVKSANRPCPLCKEEKYDTFIDKHSQRIISSVVIYCTNKDRGCETTLKIKELISHRKPNQRFGGCTYEIVECQNDGCNVKDERQKLLNHETNDCQFRPFFCDYCEYVGIAIKEHHENCENYPITCLKCSKKIPRGYYNFHIQYQCSQVFVRCEYNWAGCSESVKRKDLQQHMTERQVNHTTLLAKQCQELKAENDKLKHANERIKGLLHYTLETNDIPVLPITIQNTDTFSGYFYSDYCGYKMSVTINEEARTVMEVRIHKGRFDKALLPFNHGIVLRQGLQKIYLLHYERQSYDGFLCELPNFVTRPDDEIKKYVVDLSCTQTTGFNPYENFEVESVLEPVTVQ